MTKHLETLIESLDDSQQRALAFVLDELKAAEAKHPSWPEDIVHAGAIVAEESGELIRACLQHQYETESPSNPVLESAQTGAVALRFLASVLRNHP